MTERKITPALLIDIDGVLSPFFEHIWPEEKDRLEAAGWQYFVKPGIPPYWLNPAHGEWLRDTGCELVWATRWNDRANKLVSPVMGFRGAGNNPVHQLEAQVSHRDSLGGRQEVRLAG